jgi:hypothetical protein
MNASTTKQPPRRVILVMGMHRSGTSAATRVVNLLGAGLGGPLIPPGADNPKGFWELAAAVKINDDLLKGLGRTWYDMREMTANWLDSPAAQEALADIMRVIRKNFRGQPLCVLKDPRLCLVAPLWIKALKASGFKVDCLFVIRDPNAVVDSLHLRNEWPRAPLFLMWVQYLMEAEAGTTHSPRAMIAYEQLVSDWRGTMARVAEDLKFQWPVDFDVAASEIDGFLENGRKNPATDVAGSGSNPLRVLPGFVADLYSACRAIVDRKGDWSGIVRLRKSFKHAAELYATHIDNLLNERWAAEAKAQKAAATLADVNSIPKTEWCERLENLDAGVAGLSSRVDELLARTAGAKMQEEQAMSDNTHVETLGRDLEASARKVIEIDARLTERIAEIRSQVERSQREVQERLVPMEQRVGEQASALSALELRWQRRVDRQERLLQTLHRRLEQLEPMLIGKLDAAYAELSRRNDKLDAAYAELSKRYDALGQKLPPALAARQELADRIEALTSSTSWKVTAPLRWVKMRLQPRARVIK